MRVIVLVSILCALCLQAESADKVVSVTLSNVQHQVSIPESWTQSQGKTEWRSGSKGDELLALYFAKERSIPEAVAAAKARFDNMFTPRKIKSTGAEDAGSADGKQWTYVFTATSDAPASSTLRYLRFTEKAGKIFYLQYTRKLGKDEKIGPGAAIGKRLADLWATQK